MQEYARGVAAPDAPSKTPNSAASVAATLNAQRMPRTSNKLCPACCSGTHPLPQCRSFLKMDPDARWRVASASMTCYCCLVGGHRARNCRAGGCSECGRNHHVLLHRHSDTHSPQYPGAGVAPTTGADGSSPATLRPRGAEVRPQDGHLETGQRPSSSGPPQPAAAAQAPPAGPFRPETVPISTAGARTESREFNFGRHRYQAGGGSIGNCFFQTALVRAGDPQNGRMVRLLLDGGSDSSYIRRSLAEELGLPVVGTGTFSCIGFQEKLEEPREYDRVRIELNSRFNDGHVTIDLWSTERVCSPLPVPSLSKVPGQMPEMMADDFKGGEIDLLIGIDNLYRIVQWEQVDVGDGLRAVATVFGYVMHGCHVHRRMHRPAVP